MGGSSGSIKLSSDKLPVDRISCVLLVGLTFELFFNENEKHVRTLPLHIVVDRQRHIGYIG